MRKSTKPPANACGGKMLLPTGTLNCSGDAVGPAEYLLSPFQTPSTVIAAVTGELLIELRSAASRNDVGVIRAPYNVEKPVGAFARLHISLTQGNELNMKVWRFWPRLEALIDLRVKVLSTLGRPSTPYPSALGQGESKKGAADLDSSPRVSTRVTLSPNESNRGSRASCRTTCEAVGDTPG